jgi:hypothetical protein
MPSIIDSIKADADKAKVDLRTEVPELLAKLGINTEDEHEIFHGVLTFLVKAVESGVSTETKSLGL